MDNEQKVIQSLQRLNERKKKIADRMDEINGRLRRLEQSNAAQEERIQSQSDLKEKVNKNSRWINYVVGGLFVIHAILAVVFGLPL
ncbi:hypothetical protein [Salinibacter grassmerensis]|uniref:hypothetical protein n=1 Tax=Salinibacter grassmerensis TaxID=3040353 RepID=UPI0021E6E2CE|nr:hypothetical protein [Salinibacter grassmerensis]